MLRNTVPYNGRGACMRCRWCVGFACEVDAKCGTQNTVIPTALATGNCELRTECVAKEILTDDRGRATGVAYFDADGQLQEQPADLVVVSGSATESARLLLNSKSRLFPNGLGNRYDWVGRNLQGHAYAGAFGLFDYDTYDDLGPGASIAICDYNHGNPGLGRRRRCCATSSSALPIQFVGHDCRRACRAGARRTRTSCASLPAQHRGHGPGAGDAGVRRARAGGPAVKDDWGIPVARLSGTAIRTRSKSAKFFRAKAEAWLKEAGAITTWPRASARRA